MERNVENKNKIKNKIKNQIKNKKRKTQKKSFGNKIKNKKNKNKKAKQLYIHNKTKYKKIIQECVDDLIMPKHISRYAYYSATFILLNSLLAFYLKYYITCVLLAVVYITTLLHWSEVKKQSVIRIVDIVFVVLAFANWTIFDLTNINSFEKKVWYATLTFIIFVFKINEMLFYYQVLIHSNKYKENCVSYKKWHYFTFHYTNPNTKSRTISYYRSALTHMFTIHIFTNVIVAYCAISSYVNS